MMKGLLIVVLIAMTLMCGESNRIFKDASRILLQDSLCCSDHKEIGCKVGDNQVCIDHCQGCNNGGGFCKKPGNEKPRCHCYC
ncbi:hypothetical protein M5689_016282 [Euphorbia peplus]|nr:hypothetical protein M5689_016282 [Euphorbia peplus]